MQIISYNQTRENIPLVLILKYVQTTVLLSRYPHKYAFDEECDDRTQMPMGPSTPWHTATQISKIPSSSSSSVTPTNQILSNATTSINYRASVARWDVY